MQGEHKANFIGCGNRGEGASSVRKDMRSCGVGLPHLNSLADDFAKKNNFPKNAKTFLTNHPLNHLFSIGKSLQYLARAENFTRDKFLSRMICSLS
jgi:hypothetical protein